MWGFEEHGANAGLTVPQHITLERITEQAHQHVSNDPQNQHCGDLETTGLKLVVVMSWDFSESTSWPPDITEPKFISYPNQSKVLSRT